MVERLKAWAHGGQEAADDLHCRSQVGFGEDLREPLMRDEQDSPVSSPKRRPSRQHHAPYVHRSASDLPERAGFGVLCARVALTCGKALLEQVGGGDCHAVFDATLEHACRLYETVCYDILAPEPEPAQTPRELGGRRSVDSGGGGRRASLGGVAGKGGGQGHWRRQASIEAFGNDPPCVMSRDALTLALEHEGFRGLAGEPAFGEMWAALGREYLDVHAFHLVLRLLKLHLLCGVLPSDPGFEARLRPPLPDEAGFVRVLDWNARSIDEASFSRQGRLQEMFLTHRRPKMKMRWVHCAAVGRPTLLRLAVKYQLHPLPVEDTIKLQHQSSPLVRRYGDNFFLVIPMLRLTTESRAMLERYREGGPLRGCAGDLDAYSVARRNTDFDSPMRERRTSAGSIGLQAKALQVSGPCVVQVEQGRLALFVSGPPSYDTVISVQTKWLVRQLEGGGSTFDPSDGRRPVRRGRGLQRLLRLLARGGSAVWEMAADAGPSSPRLRTSLGGAGGAAAGVPRAGTFAVMEEGEDEGQQDFVGTEPFDLVAQEVRRDFSVLRAGNASWLLWRLLDVSVDELTPILAAYRARLQWFSSYIAKHRARASLDVEKQLLRSKVELDWLQRKARPMVRIVRHLIRERAIESDVIRYIEDVEDHLETFIEEMSRSMGICDSLREQVRSYRDRQQQRVLYVLGIVTTMFMPMQLLTGVYGMNWQDESGAPVVPGFGPLTRDRGWYLFWGLGCTVVFGLYLTFRLVLKWI